MHTRSTPLPLAPGTSAPRWLVFVALVCSAVLAGHAHAQPRAEEGALPHFAFRDSIVAADRSPSLQTTERHHEASARDGNPTQLATGSAAAAATGLGAVQLTKLALDARAAQQRRSPAQPRAPPADANRSH